VHRSLLCLISCTSLAWAAEMPREAPLQGCPVDVPAAVTGLPPADPADPRIEVFSGRAEVTIDEGAVFGDGITIRRGESLLRAPGARYDQATGEFALEGGLEFSDPQTSISGASASFDARRDALEVGDAEFQLFAVPARGSASRIGVDADREINLEDVTYTTCARGSSDWLLRADEIEIDRTKGVGTARDARLEFKGVPILWTPWISYPVTNERKSGFLLPGIGRSETRGFEVQIPYYWNIAPNFDATFTPRYMAQRGLELISEFRYLSSGHEGVVDAEYLPNDDGADEDRYLFGWNHTSHFGDWRATVSGRTVSDTAYFEDLASAIAETSQTHLRRVVDVEYHDDIWSVLLRVQDFKTLDESLEDTEKPYRIAPQLRTGAYVADFYGLDLRFDGELSVFERDASAESTAANLNPTGTRLHVSPSVSLPLDWRGLRLEPSFAYEHTAYSLKDPLPGQRSGPDRSTPIWSIDLGTVFERMSRDGGRLQTLEPRVQYVHIPFREQDDLPVFDTIEPDFNLVQLYRRNRFLGHDRLGDTDQLNIGLTSRVVDSSDGRQVLSATIGQTRFFSDQLVTLPGGSPVANNSSDWLAELDLGFAKYWKVDLGVQWDSDASRVERAQTRLQYRRDGRHVANFSYRYSRDNFVDPERSTGVKELDVSAAWPLSDRWSAVGRYNYSLLDREPIESFFGVEYENCCWGLRLVYRRYLARRPDTVGADPEATASADTAIALQLILKGLTNVGDPADRLLERGILGYETD